MIDRFRLYYLASNHTGDPAAGPNPHAIHMAVSLDGIRFWETGPVFEYPDLVDPDVFRFQDQWLMFVFARNSTIIARSADGTLFSSEGALSPPAWGTTAPVTLPDGRLRLYAFDQRTPAGNVVRSFLSTDSINWTAEEGDRLASTRRRRARLRQPPSAEASWWWRNATAPLCKNSSTSAQEPRRTTGGLRSCL